jgi:phospholipase C
MGAGASTTSTPSPVKHVVVLLEENHSFDNVLGKFCAEIASKQIVRPGYDSACDGATVGMDTTGRVPLSPALDIPPPVDHTDAGQTTDINGGKMNGFGSIWPCKTTLSMCYNQYDPLSGPCSAGSCIPNLSALAEKYAISDQTFELYASPSWGGHMYFVTATQDGFVGDNPTVVASGHPPAALGGGWGCDSGRLGLWNKGSTWVNAPTCIPDASGSLGPNWKGYTGPRAAHVPTIFDELGTAGLSWKIYGGAGAPNNDQPFQESGWQWAICPTFAECLYSAQRKNLVPAINALSDAAAGTLPAFSIITPTTENSQHNGFSVSEGDNYIGNIVSTIEKSPDWSSTVVFITYDDCGCFYDHVNPLANNAQWGIRVPMVIVSPFAKEGYTDSNPTSLVGILAFTEQTFGLSPLNSTDGSSYAFQGAFCFNPFTGCTPAGTAPVSMRSQQVAPMTSSQLAAARAQAKEDT